MVNIPKSLIAGDTWSWTADYALYPAGTWTATAYFENATESFNVASSDDGTSHLFAKTAANSAGLDKGSYFVRVRVTDGSSVHTVESGWCDVKPDPASTVANDPRTWARRTLEAVEAFLEGNATTAQASMSIGGRSISRWSIAELTQWRDRLRSEVAVENQGSGAGLGRNLKVRFERA